MAKLKLHLHGKIHDLETEPGETVLEASLREGLDAPYSCMVGSCTSCQGKLIKGTVEMEFADVLTDQEIREGEILTCQARPTSDELEVIYKN